MCNLVTHTCVIVCVHTHARARTCLQIKKEINKAETKKKIGNKGWIHSI